MASIQFLWRTPPTPWQQFRRNPATYLARWLYRRKPKQGSPPSPGPSPIRIVCVSDTHCTQPGLPGGDVLLHAGDLTNKGSFEEIQAQLHWLNTLPHKHKVVIAGNHDVLLDPDYVARFPDRIYEGEGTSRSDLTWGDIVYLNNSTVRLAFSDHGPRSLAVYGSPWTEQFGTWAFQYPPIRDMWSDSVPVGGEDEFVVLLTHGPPKGHLDLEGKGCPHLLREIWRVRPGLVVFGHIHAGRGQEHVAYDGIAAAYDGVMMGDRGLPAVFAMACRLLWGRLWDILSLPRRQDKSVRTTFVNAAVCGGRNNEERREAIVIDI